MAWVCFFFLFPPVTIQVRLLHLILLDIKLHRFNETSPSPLGMCSVRSAKHGSLRGRPLTVFKWYRLPQNPSLPLPNLTPLLSLTSWAKNILAKHKTWSVLPIFFLLLFLFKCLQNVADELRFYGRVIQYKKNRKNIEINRTRCRLKTVSSLTTKQLWTDYESAGGEIYSTHFECLF